MNKLKTILWPRRPPVEIIDSKINYTKHISNHISISLQTVWNTAVQNPQPLRISNIPSHRQPCYMFPLPRATVGNGGQMSIVPKILGLISGPSRTTVAVSLNPEDLLGSSTTGTSFTHTQRLEAGRPYVINTCTGFCCHCCSLTTLWAAQSTPWAEMCITPCMQAGGKVPHLSAFEKCCWELLGQRV